MFKEDNIVRMHIRKELMNINTMIPAKIVNFDASDITATVKIAFNIELTDGSVIETPELHKIPVTVFQAGGYVMTVPIKPDDECFLLVSQRSIDNWMDSGISDVPLFSRMFDLSDAVCIIGLQTEKTKISNYNADELEIRAIDSTTGLRLGANNTITLFADKIAINGDIELDGNMSQIGDLSVEGNIEVTSGDIVADGVSLKSHTHSAGLLVDGSGSPVTGTTGNPL